MPKFKITSEYTPTGDQPRIAVDALNKVHISYRDGDSKTLKYAGSK